MVGILDLTRATHHELEQEAREMAAGLRGVTVRSLNKTAQQSRTLASKLIREDMPVKAGTVRENLSIRRANKKRTVSRLIARHKPIGVIHFNRTRQTRQGVKTTFSRQKGPITLRGAFIATMPSGHKGVFRRKGKKRLPIRKLYGPSVMHRFSTILPQLEREAAGILEKTLESETRFYLSRKGRGI